MREISIMKKLHHKNVIKLHEIINDEDEDQLFMVLEYAEGGPVMKKNLENGPLPEATAKKYFVDVISGLEYLHQQGVIHRDIKPENLLLTAEGTVKITDFGVSYVYSDGDNILKNTAGSPAFLAPELCAAGTLPRGEPVDIWALGITLYCFIFGRVPFMAENVLEIYERIRNEALIFPLKLTAELEDLLNKLLCKDPEKRITINELKRHKWLKKTYIYTGD